MSELFMPQALSQLLLSTLEGELPALHDLSDLDASARPSGAESWSPKEEIGHLIDSAANNHVRIARACIEAEFHGPTYAQNEWVALHGYQEMFWNKIIDFWFSYNSMLAVLIARIPSEKLTTQCFIGTGEPCSLRFLIEDYILHLQHHVDHALSRPEITRYPSQKVAATT